MIRTLADLTVPEHMGNLQRIPDERYHAERSPFGGYVVVDTRGLIRSDPMPLPAAEAEAATLHRRALRRGRWVRTTPKPLTPCEDCLRRVRGVTHRPQWGAKLCNRRHRTWWHRELERRRANKETT